MSKLALLAAFGAGYVLGAKAGRPRYDQIMSAAQRVKDDPHVRSAASTVADTAREQAPVAAQKVAAAATSAASTAASAVAEHSPFGHSGSDEDDLKEKLNPDSTALQDDPYPKGDLP